MSGLPTVCCPACNARMSLDVVMGHQGARDALLALAELHPAMATLASAAVRYVGLFAPAKQVMRFDAVACRLNELAALIAPGRIEDRGRAWVTPVSYWVDAMEHMLATRDNLQLPLSGHNYLKRIVVGIADRAEGRSEEARETTRRNPYSVDRQSGGFAQVGKAITGEARPREPPQRSVPSNEAREMMNRIKKGKTA